MNLYERQILLSNIGKKGQLCLQNSSVLIVGIGGIGCPVAQYLCAMGIGRLGLVDGDVVEESNLHRQILYGVHDIGQKKVEVASKRLQEQNPFICVEKYGNFLSYDNVETLIRDYDLVIDGSDNFDCRYLVNDACVLSGMPFVSGAVDQFDGQVSVFHERGGPCYRCLYPWPPPQGLVRNCLQTGVLGVMPAIIGSIVAMEAVKVLLKLPETLSGQVLFIDALRMSFQTQKLRRENNCVICGEQPLILNLQMSKQMMAGLATASGCQTQRSYRVPLLSSAACAVSKFACCEI